MNSNSTAPAAEDVPSPTSGFLLEELDGELLLFNPQDGSLLELNATAALVWQLCDGARSVAEIIDLLNEAFPEAGQAISADVAHILADLREMQAIDWQ